MGRGQRRTLWMATLVAMPLVGILGTPLAAQQPTLDATDYDRWERLGAFELDPTGRWLVAAVTRVDGERERSDGSGEAIVLEHGQAPEFSRDGRWMAYRKGVSVVEAERGDAEAEVPVEDRLGLVNLESGSDSVYFDVRSFGFRDDGSWLAARGVPAADSVGADLIVMRPGTPDRTVIGNVDEFVWQDGGALLAATMRAASDGSNGVLLFDPESGTLRTLDSGGAEYAALTWREESSQLAVLRSVEDDEREEATHDVLVWSDPGQGGAQVLSATERAELGTELRVTPYAGIDFSANGDVVFVGVRPWDVKPDDASDDDEGPEEGGDGEDVEPADVQVWHWNDDRILRAQEFGADRIARQTLATAWHVRENRVVVLADELEEPVRVVAGGRWGLVPDYSPYLFERRFGAGTADWYRVDVRSGERTLIWKGLENGPQAHADLDRVLVHDGGWTAIGLEALEQQALGDGRSFTRAVEEYDYPGPRPSWGIGGWTADGSGALLYDRTDVWLADLEDGTLRALTRGVETNTRYRVVNLDPEQPRFGPPLLDEVVNLSTFDLRTKASGYATIDWDGSVRRETRREALVAGLTKARDADVLAYRVERWDDSPDVFVASPSLDDAVQVTRTNPFQADFAWGRAELLDYMTDAGHELQAILVYPAGFEPGRRYPLILYQYERLSDGLHRYDPPSEREYYDYQTWSQAGYFVLMPDIVYEPGRPGPSALDAVEHALDAAVATGHVDADRMGLIGHSWGGYQAVYLPTRTDRFAASVAGAAITNFMSFMGAVHWNGGLPETGHWETGQARMAVPYWEDLEGHLESSPANHITDLSTPMLLMHGDSDGVVDFYQGLEFYNYARRAGKEVVLLVYPGADHGLREESQQVDYHRRILEWFGHYLKGEAAAPWITDGESWVERGKRLGR